MSAKRSAAMANISKYADKKTQPLPTTANGNPANLGAPVAIPAPYTQPRKQKEIVHSEVNGITEERVQIVTGVSGLSALAGSGYDAGLKGLRFVRGKLEQLPTPGGIIFPLVVLFFLFIVILPVNGHTRLMWLWLAITGNAEIGGPLTQPTINPVTTSYNSGSPGTNPNQGPGATSATSFNTVSSTQAAIKSGKPSSGASTGASTMKNTVITKTSKNSTHVTTNVAKNHGGSAHGTGPGPYSILPDPTLPSAQPSYTHLLRNYNGYE